MALSWFRAADLQKLVVFCDFQTPKAKLRLAELFRRSKTLALSATPSFCEPLCGLWAGRPSKTRGFFAIFKSPARPSADFGLVDLRKLVVFCDFQIAHATLCGLWAGRPSKNSWFFAIFKSPARPSADFGLVDLRKLVVFCDFQIARATLCGLWAGRPSKTRGFLRFSNRPRDPLRTLGWSTFENSWFFAIFKSPARPSADFGLVDPRKLVVFCDFQFARATLCGVSRGQIALVVARRAFS